MDRHELRVVLSRRPRRPLAAVAVAASWNAERPRIEDPIGEGLTGSRAAAKFRLRNGLSISLGYSLTDTRGLDRQEVDRAHGGAPHWRGGALQHSRRMKRMGGRRLLVSGTICSKLAMVISLMLVIGLIVCGMVFAEKAGLLRLFVGRFLRDSLLVVAVLFILTHVAVACVKQFSKEKRGN